MAEHGECSVVIALLQRRRRIQPHTRVRAATLAMARCLGLVLIAAVAAIAARASPATFFVSSADGELQRRSANCCFSSWAAFPSGPWCRSPNMLAPIVLRRDDTCGHH